MPSVSILWGSAPEPGSASIKYDFGTQPELDAFLRGIAEADGWAGHKQVDHGYVFDECSRCSTQSDQRDFVDSLRSEEHTSELQSLMRISYAVFCLKKKKLEAHKYKED